MNRHIHDKLQVSMVTDKQAKFVGPMLHTKFDEKS